MQTLLPRSLAPRRERRMLGFSPNRPVEILLVEDSPDDAELMIAALSEGDLTVRVTVVEDGEEALHLLQREGKHALAPRPDLILLDLYLPRKNGQELLAEIKEDVSLRRIPVVVMTSSDNDGAFVAAYEAHANCCITKPADQDEFAEVVKRIEHFWLAFIQRAPIA